MLSKESLELGLLKYKTGETTAAGYTEFLDYADIQTARETASEDTSDDGTFFDVFTSGPDKYDPAGGASSSSRLLVDDSDRTPGNTLSKRMGVRRIESRMLSQDEMDPGLSYGDRGTIGGQGIAEVQRVRPVRRTSFPFTKGTVNTLRGTKTTVDVYAAPQTLPGSGATYDIKLMTARFNDEAVAPVACVDKSAVAGNAANISFSGSLMTVEFEMKDYSLSRPDTFDQPDIINVASIGGGFVASDLAHVIRNPGDGGGVQYMGDPELFLYPGDMMTFDDDAVRDIGLTCISAKAFSGSTDAAAVAPHAGAPGVPQYVRDNYNKRDVAIFEISAENGEVIRDFVLGIGASEQDIPIDYVTHGAVAPPTIDADENSTGYVPVLKKTYKTTGATTVVPTDEYLFDPNTGGFYIDSSTWGAGDYVLFVEMWVFDARKVYPCSLSSAYAALIEDLCELYYETSLSLTQAGFEFLVDTDEPYTFGPNFNISRIPSGASVPPYVAYDLSTVDLEMSQQSYSDNYTITDQYMSPATPATFIVGSTTGDFLDNPPTFRPFFTYDNHVQAYSFSSLGHIARWRSDDIEEALIEVSFEDAVITTMWQDHIWGETPDDDSSTTATEIDLVVNLLYKTSGTTYDLQGTGLSVPLPTTIIDVGGTDYLRGTVDITNLLKYVIDNINTPDIEFLLMIGAGVMPVGALSVVDLAKGWVEYFYSTRTGDGTAPYNEGMRTRWIQFTNFTMSNVYIKTAASELVNGPELPRTSDGLIVDNPDLTYDPS